MNILISPNAFKNAINAETAATAIKDGLIQSKLKCECTCFPIGDGGDGTGSLIIKKFEGKWVEVRVHDPMGRKINTSFGLIENGETAVIEMADASGLKLLTPDELNPLIASSFGTGEQIKFALNMGVKKIIIAMGGSATVDGGCGILSALGIRFLNQKGKDLLSLPSSLPDLFSIDMSGLDPRIFNCKIIVLCDVENKLLGKHGSAHVFGPQKGASEETVKRLDECLAKLSIIAFHYTGKDMSEMKYGGTAGGAAAGLCTFLNASLVNGIDYFLEITAFDIALKKSNLLITGEGSIDEQTLNGKGPFGVAFRAKKIGIPVIGFAGKVPLKSNVELQNFFDLLIPIGNQPVEMSTALKCTKENLIRTSTEMGNFLAVMKKSSN